MKTGDSVLISPEVTHKSDWLMTWEQSDTPDRNAVTLSIAVGSQNLRTASAKEKRTPAGCPNS